MINNFLMLILSSFMSFSIGIIISFGFISLVSSVGLIRNIIRTFNIKKYKIGLVSFLALGTIFGSIVSFYNNYTFILGNAGKIISVIVGLLYGVFIGYLALGLAEVFDVIPVVNNKIGFRYNIRFLVLICAIGKMFGSMLYFILPGFYSYK